MRAIWPEDHPLAGIKGAAPQPQFGIIVKRPTQRIGVEREEGLRHTQCIM
jgi:hypothetical protein